MVRPLLNGTNTITNIAATSASFVLGGGRAAQLSTGHSIINRWALPDDFNKGN